jgi:ELWxxDGT repeat protein
MRKPAHIVVGMLIAFTGVAQSQPVLVRDIYQQVGGPTFDSNPGQGVEFQNALFFSASSGEYGNELWRSDGTEQGTSLVKDISPGETGSTPSHLIVMNGQLFFMASGNLPGLWKTDGTPDGTQRVKDVQVSIGSSQVPRVGIYNNELYFSASDPDHGEELWKSDGTEAGTFMVKDIYPGMLGSTLIGSVKHHFGVAGGLLFFIAKDDTHGMELWRTDGTEAGTNLVKDIRPGTQNGFNFPTVFKEINGVVYFVANDGAHGDELWKSDGTEAGSQMVVDIVPGIGTGVAGQVDLVQGKLFFIGNGPGFEYFVSDGTEAGTLSLDINPGTANSVPNAVSPPALFQNMLYNHAIDPSASLAFP